MTNMALFAEQQVRADLARLLLAAVEASGRARCDIARDAQSQKDALRRVLAGERSASLGEALRILAASGVAPHAHLLLFLVSGGDHAIAWLQSDLAQFFEDFSGELPSALERVLGNQVHDVKPRWAKGTAHRVALLRPSMGRTQGCAVRCLCRCRRRPSWVGDRQGDRNPPGHPSHSSARSTAPCRPRPFDDLSLDERGKFPKPVQLGGYAVAWGEEDIIAWVESQLKR